MNLDIGKKYERMIELVNLNESQNKIDDYTNNYDLKVSLINVDSRHRNKLPQNIINMEPDFLSSNPIQTTSGSSTIKLTVNYNHNINVGDMIILQNCKSTTQILNNPIYLLFEFDYMIINMNNHKILDEYVVDGNYKVTISHYDNSQINNYDRLIGNIPLNSIIGTHSIDTVASSKMSTTIQETIMKYLLITPEQLNNNYFFIKLPFNYINKNYVGGNKNFNQFHNIINIYKFDFLNIGGIILQYINANYPINYQQFQSSHKVTSVNENIIEFVASTNALYTQQSGGDKVLVGVVVNMIEGYPDASNYTIQLKKSFTDVVRLELVTTEIPFVNFNIKNNVSTQNNNLYWKYLEDGEYVYNITIPEGNYETVSLRTTIITLMNKIPRISDSNVYNLFDVTFNQNSQEVQFTAFTKYNLPNSLSIQQNAALGTNLVLTIKHPNNIVKKGDIIIISNSQSIGSVSSTFLNKTHTVYSVNLVESTYTVIITLDLNISNIDLVGTGGTGVTIQIPAMASFLFNRSDTIGDILGFKNVGQPNAITPFSTIVSNFTDYILPTPFDEVGNTNNAPSLLNLSGDYYYLLLYLNDFEGIYTNSNIANAFSKILMNGTSGEIMFNSFVNSPLEFDIPLSTISELKVQFTYPDGTIPDFRNFEHSFTLRIVERISRPVKTGLSSHKINYMDSLVEQNYQTNPFL